MCAANSWHFICVLTETTWLNSGFSRANRARTYWQNHFSEQGAKRVERVNDRERGCNDEKHLPPGQAIDPRPLASNIARFLDWMWSHATISLRLGIARCSSAVAWPIGGA